MKYYKNPADASLWAYESDGSQDKLIPTSFVRLSDVETTAAIAVRSAPAGPVKPTIISAFQGKAALLLTGRMPSILAIMADAATPALTKLAWAEVSQFERDSPLLNSLATTLAMTAADVDELFVTANEIKA